MINTFSRFTIVLIALFIGACTDKNQSQTVQFEGEYFQKSWPINEINKDLPSDWSPFNYLTFEIKTSSTQRFFLTLHDAGGIRKLRLQPFQNAWVRASIPLVYFQQRNTKGHDKASINKTPLPGLWIGFTRSVGTINDIDSMGVQMHFPVNSPSLEIRNVVLTMEAKDSVLSPLPLVDKFGQWIADQWEGKVKSLEGLKATWEQEETAVNLSRSNLWAKVELEMFSTLH